MADPTIPPPALVHEQSGTVFMAAAGTRLGDPGWVPVDIVMGLHVDPGPTPDTRTVTFAAQPDHLVVQWAVDPPVWYLAACPQGCTPHPTPFDTQEERAVWVDAHTAATRHEVLVYREMRRG